MRRLGARVGGGPNPGRLRRPSDLTAASIAGEQREQSPDEPLQTQATQLADVNGTNWMSALSDDIPVSSLSIPGTHDAATKWTYLNSGLSQVQEQPIGSYNHPYTSLFGEQSTIWYDGQLASGVRYFDLRVGKKPGDDKDNPDALYLLHGYAFNEAQLRTDDSPFKASYETLTLERVWSWLTRFVTDYPTETVIVELTPEGSGKQQDIYEFLKNKAQSTLVYRGDHVPTLGEARGKIIVFANLGDETPDRFACEEGYWATPVWWGGGPEVKRSNNSLAHTRGGSFYEIWGQNYYEGLIADDKRTYVFNSIVKDFSKPLSEMECYAAEIRDNAIKKGKNAWIANFTSGNSPFKDGLWKLIWPADYYKSTITKGLKQAEWFTDDALENYWQESDTGLFTGIMAMDFVDADLARFIYRLYFYSYGPARYEWSGTAGDPDCIAIQSLMSNSGKTRSSRATEIEEISARVEPTCTEAGSLTMKAKSFEDAWAFMQPEHTYEIPAKGHSYQVVQNSPTDPLVLRCNAAATRSRSHSPRRPTTASRTSTRSYGIMPTRSTPYPAWRTPSGTRKSTKTSTSTTIPKGSRWIATRSTRAQTRTSPS